MSIRTPRHGGRPSGAFAHLMAESALPTRKVHWTPDTFSRSTACGRFVAMSGPRNLSYAADLNHSDDTAEVTCRSCLRAVARAAEVAP